MTPRWAMCLELSQARSLGPLRLWPGVEACVVGDRVWLRAAKLDAELDDACRRLPDAARFHVLADGQLLSPGALVPRGYVPDGDWIPLARWLGVEMPAPRRTGSHPVPAPLRLVRSTAICRPTILYLGLDLFAAFVQRAPQLRLGGLSFLASREGQVLVRGNPLPPLAGQQYVDRDGVIVPAGWDWHPAIDPQVLRTAAQLEPGDCLWWTGQGTCRRLPADGWVRVSRSAVRLTVEGESL